MLRLLFSDCVTRVLINGLIVEVVVVVVAIVVTLMVSMSFSSSDGTVDPEEKEKLNWSLTDGHDFRRAQMYQEQVRIK